MRLASALAVLIRFCSAGVSEGINSVDSFLAVATTDAQWLSYPIRPFRTQPLPSPIVLCHGTPAASNLKPDAKPGGSDHGCAAHIQSLLGFRV